MEAGRERGKRRRGTIGRVGGLVAKFGKGCVERNRVYIGRIRGVEGVGE